MLSFSSSRRVSAAPPVRPAQLSVRLLGEGREVLGVGGADGLQLTGVREPLEDVVADRVEYVVAGRAVHERGGDDRLVHECGDEVGHGRLVEAAGGRNRDERGQSPAAAVDGELLKQGFLVAVQEVVAPFDELLEGGTGRIGDGGVVQEHGAVLEERDDLRKSEDIHPRGRELDRERQPVDTAGDLGRQLDRPGVGREAGTCRSGALEEELDRRSAERLYRCTDLAVGVERLAARREDAHPRALGEQRRRDPSRLREHVLARVEDDERASVPEPRCHARQGIRSTDVDAARQQPHGILDVRRTGEVDEPQAVRELRLESTARLHGEAALAHSRRAGERHKAVLAQQAGDTPEIPLPPDERGGRRGEIAATPRSRRRNGDHGIVGKDRLLQAPQLRPRLEPQLVAEHPTRLLERLEGLRLATAAVEREHQLTPEPLAERVAVERGAKRRREVTVFAERESGLEFLFKRIHA